MKRYIKSAVKLLSDEDRGTQTDIAKRETNPKILAQLAQSPDFWIRSEVAFNPNTPQEILEQLAKDSHDYVRRAVFQNPSASEEFKDRIRRTLDDVSNDVEFTIHVDGMTATDPNDPEIQQMLADIKTCLDQLGQHYTSIMYLPDIYDSDLDPEDAYEDRIFTVVFPDIFDLAQHEEGYVYELADQLYARLSSLGHDINDISDERLLK